MKNQNRIPSREESVEQERKRLDVLGKISLVVFLFMTLHFGLVYMTGFDLTREFQSNKLPNNYTTIISDSIFVTTNDALKHRIEFRLKFQIDLTKFGYYERELFENNPESYLDSHFIGNVKISIANKIRKHPITYFGMNGSTDLSIMKNFNRFVVNIINIECREFTLYENGIEVDYANVVVSVDKIYVRILNTKIRHKKMLKAKKKALLQEEHDKKMRELQIKIKIAKSEAEVMKLKAEIDLEIKRMILKHYMEMEMPVRQLIIN